MHGVKIKKPPTCNGTMEALSHYEAFALAVTPAQKRYFYTTYRHGILLPGWLK